MMYWTEEDKNGLNGFKHRVYGPFNIDEWLERVVLIVTRSKAKSDCLEKFVYFCKENGLIVSYEETFIKVYWNEKGRKGEKGTI